VALYVGDSSLAVKTVTKTNNTFTLYPNPATDLVHVKLNLEKRSSVVYINIADAFGRSVYKEQRANLQNEDLTFSTSQLAAGNYYMTVLTDKGMCVKPFTVIAR